METNYSAVDRYGRPIFATRDAIEALLCGGDIDCIVLNDESELEMYNDGVEQVLEKIPLSPSLTCSVDEYHHEKCQTWFIPEKYVEFDILDYLIRQCNTDEQIERVATEYTLFEERNMINVLRWLKYFVDHCRTNGHVIGVGRGSSVSSYCLYLLGVHKIDSMKYNLDIREFLR